MTVIDQTGREFKIDYSPNITGDRTRVYVNSLTPISGFKEMTFREYEDQGYGVRTGVDPSEKKFKKIWVQDYTQEKAEDLFKKLMIQQ